MFNYLVWQKKLDLASKLSLVATGFAIPVSVTGTNIFLVLTVALSLLAGKVQLKFSVLKRNRVVMMTLLFFGLLVLSVSYTTAPWPDIIEALHKYAKLLFILFLMPLFINDEWKRAGINAFLAAMLVTLVASFAKMWGWIHIGHGGLGTIFTNHINAGFMMAFAAFIVAHRSCERSKLQWLYAILLLIICYNIFFMSEGRTGFFVFVALFAVFLWQKSGWKGLVIAGIIAPLMLVALFFASTNFKNRIQMISKDLGHYQQKQLKDNSVGLRLQFSKNSLELIHENPALGTGVGSFRTEYQENFPPDPGFANMDNPQNEYLMVAVQLGMLGLLVFLGLFYTQWLASFTLPEEFRYLAQGMIVAFMVGSLSDTFLYLAVTGYFFIYFTSLFYPPRLRNKK